MSLFSKKHCDLCGAELGLFGVKKLADGQMCKNCMNLISCWVTDRKEFTVDEMAAHLSYRRENAVQADAFQESARAVCSNAVIAYDAAAGTFLIHPHENYRLENPDIMGVEQITGVLLCIEENLTEQPHDEPELPPFVERRFSYSFSYNISVNHLWFQNICFRVYSFDVEPQEFNKLKEIKYEINAINSLFAEMGVSVETEDGSTFGYENVLSGNLPPEVIDPLSARPTPRPTPRAVPVPPPARPASPRPSQPIRPADSRPVPSRNASPAVSRPGLAAERPSVGRTPGASSTRPSQPVRPAGSDAARNISSPVSRPGQSSARPGASSARPSQPVRPTGSGTSQNTSSPASRPGQPSGDARPENSRTGRPSGGHFGR